MCMFGWSFVILFVVCTCSVGHLSYCLLFGWSVVVCCANFNVFEARLTPKVLIRSKCTTCRFVLSSLWEDKTRMLLQQDCVYLLNVNFRGWCVVLCNSPMGLIHSALVAVFWFDCWEWWVCVVSVSLAVLQCPSFSGLSRNVNGRDVWFRLKRNSFASWFFRDFDAWIFHPSPVLNGRQKGWVACLSSGLWSSAAAGFDWCCGVLWWLVWSFVVSLLCRFGCDLFLSRFVQWRDLAEGFGCLRGWPWLLVVVGYLVDPASSHMLVSKTKPCMCKYKRLNRETANGSLNQL